MKVLRVVARLLKRKLVRALVITIIVLIPAIAWLNHWSSAPSATTIKITPSAPAASIAPTYKKVTTTYFTTEVPDTWTIKPTTTTNDRLQSVSIAPPGQNGQLGLSSGLVPSDGLRGVGDYNLRLTDTTNYARSSDPALPAGAELFITRTGLPASTVFLTHNGRYAAISVSSFETVETTHDFLLHVMSAWQWTSK